MPIPKPTGSEKKDKKGKEKYISRCMTALKDDYPDNKQRLAVCFTTYRESKRKSSGKFDHLETDRLEILD